MNEKTLYKLEYDKIIDLLTEKASSFGGRSRCRRLKPMTSIEKIEAAQQETEAAFQRIVKKGRPSFGGCAPVNESLKRLEIGGTLGSGELLRICRLLENAGQVKAYGRRENGDESTDCLDGYFDQLTPILPLTSEIRRCILEEDEISDDASAALRDIRKEIKQTQETLDTTPAERTEIIEECKFRIAVYEEFVPKMMEADAIEAVIKETLAELGIDAPTVKDKGKIMKVLMPKVKGKADGKLVNQLLSGMFV